MSSSNPTTSSHQESPQATREKAKQQRPGRACDTCRRRKVSPLSLIRSSPESPLINLSDSAFRSLLCRSNVKEVSLPRERRIQCPVHCVLLREFHAPTR
jgi:hypothetical protein